MTEDEELKRAMDFIEWIFKHSGKVPGLFVDYKEWKEKVRQ